MKTSVSLNDFRNAFRSIRPDNFSYEAIEELFNYLEQLEDDCGEEIEFDPIGICCEFEESDAQAIIEAYSLECEEGEEEETARSYLRKEGVLIAECKSNQSFVYRQH